MAGDDDDDDGLVRACARVRAPMNIYWDISMNGWWCDSRLHAIVVACNIIIKIGDGGGGGDDGGV